jgi:NAD(P)H-nitrite reductase large subunit
MQKKTHVIIGTSAAGIGAVNKLLALDPHSDIVWISDEAEMPYNKCLLAGLLSGESGIEKVFTRDAAYMATHHITLMLGKRVVEVRPQEKNVVLVDGTKISYDMLFIGTGVSACRPAIPGADLAGVFTYQTLADTTNILNYVRTHTIKNIVVVGAGLSGLECADALLASERTITVVEAQSRLLPMVLDDAGSTFLVSAMQKNGVQTFLNQKITAIHGADKCAEVVLADGTTVPADMVIFAIGTRPNSDLVVQAGVELHNGFMVTTEFHKTSVAGIYAGGDAALVRNQLTGQFIPNTKWSDAVMQGSGAGSNMMGEPKQYAGIVPRASSSFFGLRLVAGGQQVCEAKDILITVKQLPNGIQAFAIKKELLIGYYSLTYGAVDISNYKQALLVSAVTNQIK